MVSTLDYYPTRLTSRFGIEHEIDGAARELKYVVQQLGIGVCGAHLVTCCDETEAEAVNAFQQWFARDMLPVFRLSDREPFRTASLGARYEWSGVGIAENHFAIEPELATPKVMVFKNHSHVAVDVANTDAPFGMFPRYGLPSPCCGALNGLISGFAGPVYDELRETFRSEDLDRLALLRDPSIVPDTLRPLATSIVQARLQGRRILLDIQEHACLTPTLYLVVSSVIMNRPNRDGEILVGMYVADHLGDERREYYMGLGDDPRLYTFDAACKPVRVAQEGMREVRDARDHREIVLDTWRDRTEDEPVFIAPEIERVVIEAAARTKAEPNYAKIALKAALPILMQFSPVPTAIMCFAAGAVGIHQVYRMHRIAGNVGEDAEARAVLAEMETALDHLPPDRAREIVELLHGHMV